MAFSMDLPASFRVFSTSFPSCMRLRMETKFWEEATMSSIWARPPSPPSPTGETTAGIFSARNFSLIPRILGGMVHHSSLRDVGEANREEKPFFGGPEEGQEILGP